MLSFNVNLKNLIEFQIVFQSRFIYLHSGLHNKLVLRDNFVFVVNKHTFYKVYNIFIFNYTNLNENVFIIFKKMYRNRDTNDRHNMHSKWFSKYLQQFIEFLLRLNLLIIKL